MPLGFSRERSNSPDSGPLAAQIRTEEPRIRGTTMEKTQLANLSDIFWMAEDNVARGATGHFRKPGDKVTLALALYPGWDQTKTGPIIVRKAQDSEIDEALRRLSAAWEALKTANLSDEPLSVRIQETNVSVSLADQCRVFEAVHTKNGKLIMPKYIGVTCYRRGEAFLLANTIRAKKGLEPATEVPAVVREYKNRMEQYADNLLENDGKTDAAMAMTMADRVFAVREMFRLNASEADIMRSLGGEGHRGMAQKLHRLCKLDAGFPDLEIVDRIKIGELDHKIFDKEKVQKLLKEEATKADVETFIATKGEVSNKPKVMSRKDIEGLKEKNPCILIKLVLDSVLKNDASILREMTLHHKAVNEFWTGLVASVKQG